MFRVVSVFACVIASTVALSAERAPSAQPNPQYVPPLAEPLPQAPPQSRIPTPASPPSQAPVINGPVSQPHGPTNLR